MNKYTSIFTLHASFSQVCTSTHSHTRTHPHTPTHTRYRLVKRRSSAASIHEARQLLLRVPVFSTLPTLVFERLTRVTRLRYLVKDELVHAQGPDAAAAAVKEGSQGGGGCLRVLARGEFRAHTKRSLVGHACAFCLTFASRVCGDSHVFFGMHTHVHNMYKKG